MFAQETILINRDPSDVYAVLADIRSQLPLWELFIVPDLDKLDDGIMEVHATIAQRHITSQCVFTIHESRPGAGLVTRVRSAAGELAAEWRIIHENDRTRVEINIEGQGGGIANSINIRQLAPRLLSRLKQYFDRS